MSSQLNTKFQKFIICNINKFQLSSSSKLQKTITIVTRNAGKNIMNVLAIPITPVTHTFLPVQTYTFKAICSVKFALVQEKC